MMEERIRPTRSGLFAIELLIAVGVFTFCAAICVGLFVRAEVMSRDSGELTRAVTAARSAAECFKAAGGDLERTAALTGGRVVTQAPELEIQYDADWNRTAGNETGAFVLTISPREEADAAVTAALAIRRQSDGAELLSWDIAALEAAA